MVLQRLQKRLTNGADSTIDTNGDVPATGVVHT